MRKYLLKMVCIALCAFMLLPLYACGNNGGEAGGKTKIKISVYAAGYGTGWIEEACRLYTEDHPEIIFKIEANNRMFDTIKTRLETNTCDSDVVLIANANYSSLVARGVLEDLSDVYASVIPDTEDTTVKDVVPKIQYEYRLRNGKIYGVPWQDAYASGFIYNKKMFRENGWEIPDTMDEFFELCDKIAATGTAPLVFGGGQQNGYAINTLNQWFVEYYGYDYIVNTFMKYDTPEIYNFTQEGRQKVYETAAKLFQGKTSGGKDIVLSGSKAFTAQAAQREFIQGHAAMDICGNWFPTEMTAYLKGYPDFEYGYMPVPHINSDKKDYQGNDSSKVRYSLDGNMSKADYIKLVDDLVIDYKKGQKKEQLKKLWREKTGTESPRAWSEKFKTPILCIIPSEELQQAKKAFSCFDNATVSDTDIQDALNYFDILAVPVSSKHKDIAKDFLLSMYTKESYQTFVEANHGVLRPMNVNIDADALDDFSKTSYNYFNAGKQADQYIYECSLAPMAVNGYLALLISQNGNTLGNLINAASYTDAMNIAATAAADDYVRASEMWDFTNNKWKDSYLGVE